MPDGKRTSTSSLGVWWKPVLSVGHDGALTGVQTCHPRDDRDLREFRRKADLDNKLGDRATVIEAPDLLSAINMDPEAFGYAAGDVVVRLNADEAVDLCEGVLSDGADKLRTALTEKGASDD